MPLRSHIVKHSVIAFSALTAMGRRILVYAILSYFYALKMVKATHKAEFLNSYCLSARQCTRAFSHSFKAVCFFGIVPPS